MKVNWSVAAVAAFTAFVYAGTIVAGLRIKDLSMDHSSIDSHLRMDWQPPLKSSIPANAHGDSILFGALLFEETPLYASQFTKSKVRCASCHAEGGMQSFASPVVGLPALFPMYNERAGRIINLKDRIQECFVRSENGLPLNDDGREMRALVDYIEWLSVPQPTRGAFKGRGLVVLPDLIPDPVHGAEVYAHQCSGCHGQHGEGKAPQFPPVWGPDSFNDGAGMHGVRKMAAFVQHNMPQNRMGTLLPQDAYDVSAFIHAQPRPVFNDAYKSF